MERMFAGAVLALACGAALMPPARGQGFSSMEIERRLQPGGGYVPWDGMSYNERYSYQTGAFFYPSMNPRELIYQDYLDRLDRALKFGYRIPQDPFTPGSPYYHSGRTGRLGLGLGLFRWR